MSETAADADRTPAVDAVGLRQTFGDVVALDGVDLTVARGEIVALLGPNGAGKSALLGCLSGARSPTAGTCRLFDAPPSQRRDRLSLLVQGGFSLPGLTGRETLVFYRRLHPCSTDRWRSLAAAFGLEDDLDRLVRNYSGGMRRRLALVAALAVDADVYLLDEPAANLDPSVRRTLRARLRARRRSGAAILLTSHTPSDLDIADRALFMRDGEIVAAGAPEALRARTPKPVRLLDGRVADLDRHLRAGQLFDRDGEFRAFLRSDSSLSALRADFDGRVEPSEPSFADVFDYHVRVDPRAAVGGRDE
ncbi:ATP-binding cassette domain-containing protein [Haloferacaceae archaeon DSL9]